MSLADEWRVRLVRGCPHCAAQLADAEAGSIAGIDTVALRFLCGAKASVVRRPSDERPLITVETGCPRALREQLEHLIERPPQRHAYTD